VEILARRYNCDKGEFVAQVDHQITLEGLSATLVHWDTTM
jgi:hypothetical protein